MRKFLLWPGWLAVLMPLSLIGCKGPKVLPASDTAAKMPLLNGQQHVGMIEGFNPDNSAQLQDSVDQAWTQAYDAGMDIGRLQIDWTELEPEEGEYDKEALRGPLAAMQAKGLQPMLTLAVIESEDVLAPEYLEGRAVDDKRVLERFSALMEWVIPMLTEYGGWAIAIGNEPDNAFAERRKLVDEVITFLRYGRGEIHRLNPDMAVTITLNIGNAAASQADMEAMLEHVDVASFNLYGAAAYPLFRPLTEAENQVQFDLMLAMSGDKQVILQELGMHTDTDLMNSSEAEQADFFDFSFTYMEQHPRIRAAYVFQLVDWSPAAIEVLNTLYEPSVDQTFIDQYSVVLATLGVMEFGTGRTKPAWPVILAYIEKFAE